MKDIARPMPQFNADEQKTLEGWLDFHRVTLAIKCDGLGDAQAATASVPPSSMTLIGLVQHMAEVERGWFRRKFAGEQVPALYEVPAGPAGPDGGFEVADGATVADAITGWQAEIASAKDICAAHSLTDTCRFMNADVSLRWIYVHLIEEYARHNGHADLLRERIDSSAGV